VDKVLLGKLHEEVGIQSNVELEVARGLLGRGDVKVKCLVKQLDCLIGVSALTPLDERLKVDQVRAFLTLAARLIDLVDELELLLCIIELVLFHSAVDHPNERSHVALVERHRLLVSLVCVGIVALNLLLKGDF